MSMEIMLRYIVGICLLYLYVDNSSITQVVVCCSSFTDYYHQYFHLH